MSKSTNLRPEAGGHPARSNSTDVKNPTSAPADGNDFPDAPDHAADEAPQDKPDPDAFARRLGTDTIETGDGLDAVADRTDMASSGHARSDDPTSSGASDPRLVIGGLGAVVAALIVVVSERRGKKKGLAAKAAALGAAAQVVRR